MWMTAVLIGIYVTDLDKWSWVTNLGRSNTHAMDQALRLPVQFLCIAQSILSIVKIYGLILMNLSDSLQLLPYGNIIDITPETLLFDSLRDIFVWPVPCLFYEGLIVELFGLWGLSGTVAYFSAGGWTWTGPVVFILACWFCWVRDGRRHEHIKATAEDRVTFKELWERIMSTEPGFQHAVSNLRTFQLQDFPLADMTEKRLCKAKEFLQDAIRKKARVLEHQATHMLEEDITKELLSDVPVMSLDQLYA